MEKMMVATKSAGTTFALYFSSCPFDLALALFWLAVCAHNAWVQFVKHENLYWNHNTNEGQPCSPNPSCILVLISFFFSPDHLRTFL
jgi:hypothetical protein